MKIVTIQIEKLIPYARNARLHNDAQIAQIAGSIKEFGFTNPVLIDAEDVVIAGHGRVLAARRLAMKTAPCIRLAHLTEAQRKAYRIADNRLAEIGGGWDEALLKIELDDLASRLDFDLSLIGFTADDLAELSQVQSPEDALRHGALAERFIYPPFSVFDARSAWWQERKQQWIDLGISSDEGRSGALLFSSKITKNFGRAQGETKPKGTSIFDPVLCELLCHWFSPRGGLVLDPFAGGSVRGIVAGALGRDYLGIDLRPEQVAANRAQSAALPLEKIPRWLVGDSRDIRNIASGTRADFILSCPPYADLEVYSDDPADLSNLDYADFLTAYHAIISDTAALLRDDRFACFVVGDVRDKKTGLYRNFVADTIAAFRDAGLALYNDAVLVTMVGSLPIRVGAQFSNTRKLGKTHQNVLVFVKGDPRAAAMACGDIAVNDIAGATPSISYENENEEN